MLKSNQGIWLKVSEHFSRSRWFFWVIFNRYSQNFPTLTVIVTVTLTLTLTQLRWQWWWLSFLPCNAIYSIGCTCYLTVNWFSKTFTERKKTFPNAKRDFLNGAYASYLSKLRLDCDLPHPIPAIKMNEHTFEKFKTWFLVYYENLSI